MAWQPSNQDIANRDTLNALRARGKSPYGIFFPGGCRGTIGCLFVAIVLGFIASAVGLGISHGMYQHPSVPPLKGPVDGETDTLNEGQLYGLSDSGHLSQVGGPAYFLQMTSSGLSFASDVNMIAPPISAIADTGDPAPGRGWQPAATPGPCPGPSSRRVPSCAHGPRGAAPGTTTFQRHQRTSRPAGRGDCHHLGPVRVRDRQLNAAGHGWLCEW